jgi:hypothetical protein
LWRKPERSVAVKAELVIQDRRQCIDVAGDWSYEELAGFADIDLVAAPDISAPRHPDIRISLVRGNDFIANKARVTDRYQESRISKSLRSLRQATKPVAIAFRISCVRLNSEVWRFDDNGFGFGGMLRPVKNRRLLCRPPRDSKKAHRDGTDGQARQNEASENWPTRAAR